MKIHQRSALARLGLVLMVLILAGMACTLSGGGDKKKQPTVAANATITPPATRTPFATFTPFPSLTPGQGFQALPTATRIVLNPTGVFIPTWTPISTVYPYDVRIAYPVDGSQVAGYITIVGSASHPRFLQYALEWGPDPNPGNLWYPITAPQRFPVLNGGLGAWNTTLVSDGTYQVRLHVWLNDGTETFDWANALRVSNKQPTAVPTLTKTPKPNKPPTINPIPSQEVAAGQALKIDVTTKDPDKDTVNLFVSSSNTSIANPQVSGLSQITIAGVTAGAATITVTANDNHGGLANTAFIVTVKGQNHAPVINPILSQTLNINQTLDITVTASDADGDPLTLTADTDNAGIVIPSVLTNTTVRLTGVAVGTANVTVTVNDGKGGVIKTTFQVLVGQPNQPPVIQMIAPQTMTAGNTLNVGYTASDPDNDALQQTVGSDTLSVVTASISTPGTIQLIAVNPGTATVTLTVNDGKNAPVIATFAVTVVAGNAPPSLNAIAPQTMNAGQTLDVAYSASDPEGDPLAVSASSDNPGVVSANPGAPGVITLVAAGAGTATVTVSVNDGHNAAVSTTFTVSVAAPNQPPVIQPIGGQAMNVGQALDVAYSASDPENDPLAVSASSDNPNVVSANPGAPGVITLNALAGGSANVTVSINNGHNPAVGTTFAVSVTAPNMPPSIQPIGGQAMNIGQALDVAYSASDPEGDPLAVSASSDNPGVVSANPGAPGVVTLNALAGGSANVTVTVNDGHNPAVSTAFAVSVAMPNQPPSIQPIGGQTMNVGQALDVAYSASDPEGDPLAVSASSDNPGVVSANPGAPGVVTLNALAGGSTNVTVTVNDGHNAAVSTVFAVSVGVPNANPALAPIGSQSVNVGASLSVPVSASDPDGDPLTVSAVSDNPAVASALASSAVEVLVTGVAPGSANITVGADDGKGGSATTMFVVTVVGVNNPPVIQLSGDQSLKVGEQISVPVTIYDPDGDPVTVTAIAQDGNIVSASAVGTDTITLQGLNPGSTAVQVTADDAKGGVVNAAFNVTVSAQAPSFDVMAYPVLPDVSQSMAASLSQLYQSGVSNFGVQAGAFSKVGDDAMDSPNFMVPFATGQYDLSGHDGVQGVIDVYNGTPVRPAIDPGLNSFNVDSVAAGSGYGIDSLSSPAPAVPPCDTLGGTALSCEFQATKPSIALISFSAPNVVYMNPDQFRAELQSLVADSMSNYGVIPVLATIPAGGGYSTDQLAPYNQVIVEVATQSGVTGIPLWNLARAMQERGISDPNSVAPEGPANFSDSALNYGYNIRNLTALQTLKAVRQAVGIN